MHHRTVLSCILAIAIAHIEAIAKDYYCADTPTTIASLPIELRSETSLLSSPGLAQSENLPAYLGSETLRLTKQVAYRWIINPPEQQSFGGTERPLSAKNQGGVPNPIKSLRDVPVIQTDPNALQRVIRLPDGTIKVILPDGTIKVIPPQRGGPIPKSQKKSPSPLRPIDGQAGIQAAELNRVSQSPTFNALKKVFLDSSSCNYIVIGKWDKKHQEIADMLLLWSHEQLARDYNVDAAKFMQEHGVDITTALAGYTATTRELLDACFKPAENTTFIKNTNVLKQMGRITYAMDSECTATLIGDHRYIITARHCFSKAAQDPASAKHMWFIPYLSSDRFQVCSVAEKNALATEKFESISYDQVLVRVAPTGVPLASVKTISNQEIKTTADEKKGDRAAPLLLASVSYFPLAPIVSPEKFASGYVVPQTEICAAIAKDKSCFAHICSAVGGGSGSPIFVESGAKIVLAGTHVGGSTDTVGACQQSGAQINAAASMHISDAPKFFSSAAQQ